MEMPAIDFEALVRNAGDAVVIVDRAGSIVFWNQAAERIFGFGEDEALGKSLDLIIPERLRERHWAGFRATMISGSTRYGADVLRVPALHKDGRPLSIAFTVCLLRERPDEAPSSIAAFIRDDTQRWLEDKKRSHPKVAS
jgi:PAS domain S-box-containing protein